MPKINRSKKPVPPSVIPDPAPFRRSPRFLSQINSAESPPLPKKNKIISKSTVRGHKVCIDDATASDPSATIQPPSTALLATALPLAVTLPPSTTLSSTTLSPSTILPVTTLLTINQHPQGDANDSHLLENQTCLTPSPPVTDQTPTSTPESLAHFKSSSGTKKRTRGKAVSLYVERLPPGTRIKVVLTNAGLCLDDNWVTRLGAVTRTVVPIFYHHWHDVPKEIKDQIIHELAVHFDWGDDPCTVDAILRACSDKHRKWRNRMKKDYFDQKDYEFALAHGPPDVLPEHWRLACEYWNAKKAKDESNKNKASRACAPGPTHSLGRTSIMKLKDQMAAKDMPATRMDIYELSRTRVGPNGEREWLDPSYEDRYNQMQMLINPPGEGEGSCSTPLDPEEAFRVVMPPEHGGRVRGAGAGHTMTSWYGRKGYGSIAIEQRLQAQLTRISQETITRDEKLREESAKIREESAAREQFLKDEISEMKRTMDEMCEMLRMMTHPPLHHPCFQVRG